MISATSNFSSFASRYRARVAGWDAGLKRAMNTIGAQTNAEQLKNLSGEGLPGSYPIPQRTKKLYDSAGYQAGANFVVVFNTAKHAWANTEGFYPYGNFTLAKIRARPFLHRAAAKVDGTQILHEVMLGVLSSQQGME